MTVEYQVRQGPRYRIKMRNATDDIHPVHLHRHSFEITKYAGSAQSGVMKGVMKDVVMVGGYQEVEIEFVIENPDLTLFHCHQQLHIDFVFMTLFDYAPLPLLADSSRPSPQFRLARREGVAS